MKMDRETWMYRLDRFSQEYLDNLVEFEIAANDHRVHRGESHIWCPCTKCQNCQKFDDWHIIQGHLITEGFMSRYTRWSEHGELLSDCITVDVGSNYDDVDDSEDDNRDNLDEMLDDIEDDVSPLITLIIEDFGNGGDAKARGSLEEVLAATPLAATRPLAATFLNVAAKTLVAAKGVAANTHISCSVSDGTKFQKLLGSSLLGGQTQQIKRVLKVHCFVALNNSTSGSTANQHGRILKVNAIGYGVQDHNLLMDRETWMYRLDRFSQEYLDNLVEFEIAANDHRVHRGESHIWCPCTKCQNCQKFDDWHIIQGHLITEGFMSRYTRWSEHGELLSDCITVDVGSNYDDVDDSEDDNRDNLDEMLDDIEVYDAYKKEHFQLRAMIYCTISDFPAYADLSGYSTKGKKACPLMEVDCYILHLMSCICLQGPTDCELMLPYGTRRPTLAKGTIFPLEDGFIHSVPFEAGHVKVSVDIIYDQKYHYILLPVSPHEDMCTLGAALHSYIQWPRDSITLIKERQQLPESNQIVSPVQQHDPQHPALSPTQNTPPVSTIGKQLGPQKHGIMVGPQRVEIKVKVKHKQPGGQSQSQTQKQPGGQSQSQTHKQQVSQVQKRKQNQRVQKQVIPEKSNCKSHISTPDLYVRTRDDYEDVEQLLHNVQEPFKVLSEPGMFNTDRTEILISKEVILDMLSNQQLDISCVMFCQMMLHSLMPISRMENKCAFINPQEITEPRCEYDDEYGTEHVIKHLVDVMKFHEKKQFFLAPYWKRHGKVGGHWMLLVICPHQFKGYILDSVFGSKELKSYKIVHHVNRAVTRFKKDKTNKACFSPTSWSFPKCNKQLDNWECGYYVMRWMHEFVLFRQHNFPQNNWKDNTPFSSKQLEERVNSWVNSFGPKYLRQLINW
ncbi:hypothetical protein LXL04_002581 [Taraxacum kok-saghyz]